MANSTILINYLGSAKQYIFEVDLGPKQKLAKTFTQTDTTYDVSDIASLGELNRNATIQSLRDAGTISITTTKNQDDVTGLDDEADAEGIGSMIVVRTALAAGGGGSPDDVTAVASVPFACRVIDAWAKVSTNVMGSTLTARDATGGMGNALSSAFDSATTGVKRDALDASVALSAGDAIYIRRSDDGVAGEVFLVLERV